jgi:hypothetical protein
MLVTTITIVSLLVAGVGIVLVVQIDALRSRIGLADRLGFVPRWSFFAPTPGVHNFYLLYRIRFDDGTVGQWMSLCGLDRFRSQWAAIWNPDRRTKKTVFDLAAILVQERADDEHARALIQLSIPYLLILNYISGLSPRSGVNAVQFLVMENYQDGSAYPVFVSALHSMES